MAIKVIGKDIYVDQYDCGVDVKFNVKNTDGTPYDLTDYSAQFIVKLKKDDDDSQSIKDLVLFGGDDGIITVSIDKYLSDNPVGAYYYAIRLFKNGVFVNTIIQGKFNIVNNTFENGGGIMAEDIIVDVIVDSEAPVVDVKVANRVVKEIKPVLTDETLTGDGINVPMGVNAGLFVTNEEYQAIIPSTATPDNPVADQGFVNSSIQTSTAHFRGNWDTWADVPSDSESYPKDAYGNRAPTQNDYLVINTDEQQNGGTWRYKYIGVWDEQGKDGWQAEYQVNETPLTAAQLAALNSGITEESVATFVKKTDVATSSKLGLLLGAGSGFRANIYGLPQCDSLTTTSYKSVNNSYFISKGSIENLKDDIVKRGITANSITLTDAEKTAAKNWLGITSGGGGDVDLSNYVQKTDYANSKTAGVVKGYAANGFSFVPDTGQPYCEGKSLTSYNSSGGNLFVGKATLENIKYYYVKDGIAKNTYTLSDSEKEKVRNWIGAGVPTAFETMPDIYAAIGKIYQYTGETTEEFTSGYFYTAVSQGLSYIASDSNLTFDFDLFWSELASAGITLEMLRMTDADKERGGFSIIGTVESETNYRVLDINGISLDVLLTQSIRSTSEYVGMTNRWYYKPSETFAWERVDVQPAFGGATLPTEDGTYVLKCVVVDGVPTVSWVKE